MAAKRHKPLDPDTLTPLDGVYGRRQVRQLEAFLATLRTRERIDAHGNRRLFLSDLFVAQLLAFHHPTVRSLRMLDALSTTDVAQQVLHAARWMWHACTAEDRSLRARGSLRTRSHDGIVGAPQHLVIDG